MVVLVENQFVREEFERFLVEAVPDVRVQQVEDISGALVIDPFELINSKIRLSLEKYHRACQNAQV